jgi:nitrous oxidase accessory protein
MERYKFLACIFILIFYLNPADAKIITVGKEEKIKFINEAIHLANSGDIIEVKEGIYDENVVISKSIQLRGINFPSINAHSVGNVVLVTAGNVLIEGFKIENSERSSLEEYCGIKVEESAGVIVRNNQLLNNSIGINFKKSNSGIIQDNYVITSITDMPVLGNAIHCWNCDSLSIKRNKASKHRDGIYLEFVKDSEIDENIVEDCIRYGLHFMFSHRDNYKNNIFRRNGAGVAVMYSRQVDMTENVFEYNISDISYGMLLKDISEGIISHNRFFKNSIGIFMDGTNKVELKNNTFKENGLGIRIVASSSNNLISENDFTGNTFDVATNGRALNNQFQKNYWDKYRGYDLDKNGFGDVPYRPLSNFSKISEYNPMAMLFFRSIIANLLDVSEKIFPTVTPDNVVDEQPAMKQILND